MRSCDEKGARYRHARLLSDGKGATVLKKGPEHSQRQDVPVHKSNVDERDTSGRAWLVRAAKVFIFGAIGVFAYFAHAALTPVALALLLALILAGPVEALHKRGVARAVSAALLLVITLSLTIGLVSYLWTPTQTWLSQAPQTLATIKKKVQPLTKFISHLDDLGKKASDMSSAQANTATPVVESARESAPALILDTTGPVIVALLTFVVVTLFLLTGGPPMLARMTAALAHDLQASHVLHIIEKVRAEVGHFYLTTTMINIGLGTFTGLTLWAWGMPTPYLWGAVAGVVNYVPYAGPAFTLLVITVVAAVSFNTLSQVVGVAGTYLCLTTIEGQVVQPLLVGLRLEINPLLIFLGLWFGGIFWGIAGVILATPTLVALKVIAENAESGKSAMEFLGPNNQSPHRDARLFQFAGRKSS